MIGIAEMFAELDGYDRYAVELQVAAAYINEKLRERWRENKRRQRAAGKVKPDRDAYARRYASDAAFRERRKAYWRERDRKRRELRLAARKAAA